MGQKINAELGELLGFSKEHREAMLRQAVDCYSEGALERAERILLALIALDSQDVRPLELLGSVLLLTDRPKEAERIYERAYQLDPNDPFTLVALAEIRLEAWRVNDAVPLLRKLLSMDPAGEHPAVNRARYLIEDAHRRLCGKEGA